MLLKAFDASGFVFFTNYNSTKAEQIAGNSNVSLLFPWLALERQGVRGVFFVNTSLLGREGYLTLAAAEPDRFVVIDGSGTPDEVFERMMSALAARAPQLAA